MRAADARTPAERAAERERAKARRALWARGVLDWKFDQRPWCREFYDWMRAHWGAPGFLAAMMHRRAGKTSVAYVIALEECLRTPATTVVVIAQSVQQARDVGLQVLEPLLADCPKALRPRFIRTDFTWRFDHNGSSIVICPASMGSWGAIRGRRLSFVFATEAAFIPQIDQVVAAIMPALRDVTDAWSGTMLLESTPPETSGHPFQALWDRADGAGRTFKLPLSANKHAGPHFRESAAVDSGGTDTPAYRREYELEFVLEDATVAVPEATAGRMFYGDKERGLPPVVRELGRPPEAELYVSLDPGGKDLTAVCFAHYNQADDLVVVEDELALADMTTDVLALNVRAKEAALWPGAERVSRFADNNNPILLYDLQRLHSITFTKTAKDEKDAQINFLRLLVRDGKIAIHPRCQMLIKTLKVAKRSTKRHQRFLRSGGVGHADMLDALIYLIRNVRRRPLPAKPQPASQPMASQNLGRKERKTDDQLAQALGLGRGPLGGGFFGRRRFG